MSLHEREYRIAVQKPWGTRYYMVQTLPQAQKRLQDALRDASRGTAKVDTSAWIEKRDILAWRKL